MPRSSVVPCKTERIAARVVYGEALLMVIDRREMHRLNDVGTRVFELCDGVRDVDAIVSTIVEEFAVEPEVAEQDVVQFISQLVATGAVALSERS